MDSSESSMSSIANEATQLLKDILNVGKPPRSNVNVSGSTSGKSTKTRDFHVVLTILFFSNLTTFTLINFHPRCIVHLSRKVLVSL